MDLSPTFEAGVRTAGSSAVPAKAFKSLVKAAAAVLLEQADEAALQTAPGVAEVDPVVMKQSYAAVCTLLTQAASNAVSEDTLMTLLEDLEVEDERRQLLAKTVAEIGPELRSRLRRSAFSLPHVVDVKWRLDFSTKSNQLERVNEPIYTVTLHTETAGGKPGQVELACNLSQLQDLLAQLKSANKSLESLAGQ